MVANEHTNDDNILRDVCGTFRVTIMLDMSVIYWVMECRRWLFLSIMGRKWIYSWAYGALFLLRHPLK